MRACRLRAAYAKMSHPQHGRRQSPAQRLGNVCHRVLAKMVVEGNFMSESWQTRLYETWDEEVVSEMSAVVHAGDSPQTSEVPERWPGYEVKRARLRYVGQRVRDLLLELPAGATVLPEVPLEGYERRLRGIADLVLRSQGAHRVVDYKTGGVLDGTTQLPREKYVRQLQMYAALEAESSGEWPDTLHLLPLRGAPVEIAVDPVECADLAVEALELLSAYNAMCPERQPASPGQDTCSTCPFSARCPDFWESCESWSGDFLAVRGRAVRTMSTELNGISVELAETSGTVPHELVLLRNIDPEVHPAARDAVVGTVVAATGLWEEKTRGTYRVPPWGHLECIEE